MNSPSWLQESWNDGLYRVDELHLKHVNPQMPKFLQIFGLDKKYVRAEGAHLWDAEGNDYLDLVAGYSVFSLGHNPPAVREALKECLDQSWPNIVQVDLAPLSGVLAEKLVAQDPTGRLQSVYFGNSGSESVEAAMKFARAATGRPRWISFEGSFHGLTIGALSLGGNSMWREGFGPLIPECTKLPWGDLAALERELRKKDVSAVIAEPIQGEGGVRELTGSQWREIQALCRKYGTLLVMDEVQTGMGRTGKFYAYEHYGLEPDLVCLSKAFTSGFCAGSATLGTREVFDRVFSRVDRCLIHSSTFSENNLAMVSSLAVLREMERLELVRRAEVEGEVFRTKIREGLKDIDLFKEVRGRGFMIGIEFGKPDSGIGRKLAWSMLETFGKSIFGQMVAVPLILDHRILAQGAAHDPNTMKICPPLILNHAEMDRFVSALREVLLGAQNLPGAFLEYGQGVLQRAKKKV